MIPAWLRMLSAAFLLLGLACAIVIVGDLVRHRQHMWIMNVLWPVTALFGTVWVVWQYLAYGRFAKDEQEVHAISCDGRHRRAASQQRLHVGQPRDRMAGASCQLATASEPPLLDRSSTPSAWQKLA